MVVHPDTGKQVCLSSCVMGSVGFTHCCRCWSLWPSRGRTQVPGPSRGAWWTPGRRCLACACASSGSHLHIHQVSVTVKREFMEEALDSTGEGMGEKVEALTAMVDKFFDGGEEVYR